MTQKINNLEALMQLSLEDILSGQSGTTSAAQPESSPVGDGTAPANDSSLLGPAPEFTGTYSELEPDEDPVPIPGIESEPQAQEPVQEPEQEPQAQAPVEPEPQEPTDINAQYKELQAAYTKARQELAATKAKATALEKHIASASIELPEDVKAELEQLKYTDPETWRQRVNAIENQRAKDLDTEISKQVEIQRRVELLAEYNQANPQYQINDYVAENVLPRGMVNKLERGEVSFESFLKEASNFLKNTVRHGPGNSANAGRQSPITKVGGSAQVMNVPAYTDDDDTVW